MPGPVLVPAFLILRGRGCRIAERRLWSGSCVQTLPLLGSPGWGTQTFLELGFCTLKTEVKGGGRLGGFIR